MGCCGSKTDAVPAEMLKLPPATPELQDRKTARVIIIGAGPAGVHMASRLKRHGFEQVTVLEKEPAGAFGKTYTYLHDETGDTPHEMGTCYLSWSYKTVRSLIGEYLGDGATIEPGKGIFPGITIMSPKTDENKGQEAKAQSSDEWLYSHCEEINLPAFKQVWGMIPDKAQVLDVLLDIKRYRELHESILGKYDYHGLPPKPGPKALSKLDVTYNELMTENGLKPILDLTCVGFGSYGLAYDVPALYGLWFVTPTVVESYIKAKLDNDVKTVELVKDGFQRLWEAMVKKDGINVRYNSNVQKINRNLQDRSKPVVVQVNGEDLECDLLVFAAPLWSQFLPLVEDATEFEKEVCGAIKTVGLVVSLFETAKKESKATEKGERSLTFYADSLMPERTPDPQAAKAVYAERESVRAFRPERDAEIDRRYSVAYQYLPTFDPDVAPATLKAVEFITDAKLAVEPTATDPAPKLLCQKNWDYFPHFTQDAVQKLLPWKLFEAQGANRTWYIGSSCCFESTEDVTRYNDQLLRHMLGPKASPGGGGSDRRVHPVH